MNFYETMLIVYSVTTTICLVNAFFELRKFENENRKLNSQLLYFYNDYVRKNTSKEKDR